MATSPQTGYLGVPPLVGREWSAEERHAYEHGYEGGARHERDWGPPARSVAPWTRVAAVAAFLAAAAAAVWGFGLYWTPDRALLVFFVPALVLGRGRRYLLDFVPFAALIVLYGECRGIVHVLHPHPYYLPQLKLEQWLFFGHLPTAMLQHWLWTGDQHWYDQLAQQLLRVHFIVPPLLAFALWLRRRALFYRFGATMLLLSYAGALSFFLFPAAPPWAAASTGRITDVVQLPAVHSASVLPSAVGAATIQSEMPRNPYAAIPSLHAGYSFLVFLFVASLALRKRTKWRWALVGVAALYPLLQTWTIVYTANHYVVDVLIGFAYAGVALWVVKRVWRRFELPE